MVEKASLSRKIDVRLRSLGERFEALAYYAGRFGPLARDDRGADWYALEAEWQDTLHRLEWVHELHERGELTPRQAKQHRQNIRLLRSRLPLLTQLGLAVPGGAIAAWIDTAGEVAELV